MNKFLGNSQRYTGDRELKYFKKFTFVRHPFTRIVSTYKDKIIDWTNYRDWRRFIGFDKKQPYKVCL